MDVEPTNGIGNADHTPTRGSESPIAARPLAPFLQLPGEILSQIASYLPSSCILPYLSTHPILLALTQSHLSPLPPIVNDLLLAGPPYPHLLTVLPSLRSFLPPAPDDARMVLEILVRARPRWILERLEVGRWPESVWQEAFERRYLPSWKAFKKDDDSWRAVFLRILGRLEHRNLGCTHEESWTRFVTIHRNGSAGINRYYSRLFDPYDIYDELKSQNNFASHPTQVRVVVHLQDVRILAVGVLSSEPTLFINPNAHRLLHPPLLGENDYEFVLENGGEEGTIKDHLHSESSHRSPHPASSLTAESNEAYFPLVRTLSPSTPGTTSYGLGDQLTPRRSTVVPPPPSPSLASAISRVLPGRRRRNTEETGTGIGASLLSPSRSREGDGSEGRRRSWAFGRNRTGSNPNILEQTISREQGNTLPPRSPAMPPVPEQAASSQTPPGTKPLVHTEKAKIRTQTGAFNRPYPTINKPVPVAAFVDYPNFSPVPATTPVSTIGAAPARVRDTRPLYPEVEDDSTGQLWASEAPTHNDEIRMVEWSEARSRRERWVGPMILVAQLFPATRREAWPQSANPGPIEGPQPDLGPKGMYASLAFEDISALLPWVEFTGGGAHHAEAMRNGLGYE